MDKPPILLLYKGSKQTKNNHRWILLVSNILIRVIYIYRGTQFHSTHSVSETQVSQVYLVCSKVYGHCMISTPHDQSIHCYTSTTILIDSVFSLQRNALKSIFNQVAFAPK